MIAVAETIVDRVAAVDWAAVDDVAGRARIRGASAVARSDGVRRSSRACTRRTRRFRSRIDMTRFRFGVGEYKYFAAPLPGVVQSLREALYARLAPIANPWSQRLHRKSRSSNPEPAISCRARRFPCALPRARPEEADALLLSDTAGGYNCLHQDIYGERRVSAAGRFALTRAEADYSGGEFLLVEQRPRAQSRGHAARIAQGAGIVFATRDRPVAGTRGDYRVMMRHGVSTVTRARA